jgi:hypothetical protein
MAKDFEDVRDELVDRLMEDETVAGCRLKDILEGDMVLASRLAKIWKTWRSYQQHAYDDLEDDCRKAVYRFVVDHLDDEVNAILTSMREDADEYEPTI